MTMSLPVTKSLSLSSLAISRALSVILSVLQYVAVCCSVLQCVAAWYSALQCVAVSRIVLQCVAVCCMCFSRRITKQKKHKQGQKLEDNSAPAILSWNDDESCHI